MMVIGQGKMNMDAPCVSRRPPQRRKRCLLALLHAEAGDLEALGMDVLHAKMLRVRPGAAEKRCVRRRAQWKKERQEKAWTGIRCRNMACPGVAGRAGISRAGHEKRRKPCGIRLWKGTPLPFCAAGAAAAGVAPHRGRRRHEGKAKGQIWSILLLKRSLFQRIILAQNVTFARIHTTWRRQPPWCQQSIFNVKLLYLV